MGHHGGLVILQLGTSPCSARTCRQMKLHLTGACQERENEGWKAYELDGQVSGEWVSTHLRKVLLLNLGMI